MGLLTTIGLLATVGLLVTIGLLATGGLLVAIGRHPVGLVLLLAMNLPKSLKGLHL